VKADGAWLSERTNALACLLSVAVMLNVWTCFMGFAVAVVNDPSDSTATWIWCAGAVLMPALWFAVRSRFGGAESKAAHAVEQEHPTAATAAQKTQFVNPLMAATSDLDTLDEPLTPSPQPQERDQSAAESLSY
jgi:threonine/homoserine/homoserine lactone efflux protein